ncbi:MAG: GrpB family protein [Patescibacteria group bacterium]
MKVYDHQPLSYYAYDPAWNDWYEKEKKQIEEKLGDVIFRIEHIGSTAVPGLSGKPIVDILIVIKSADDLERCSEALQELDYQQMGKSDQYYLRKSMTETAGFHIHMVALENKFWRERIAFRDYLRSHPEVAQQYMSLKQDLITKFDSDKDAYREGKGSFMAEITKKALEENPI